MLETAAITQEKLNSFVCLGPNTDLYIQLHVAKRQWGSSLSSTIP